MLTLQGSDVGLPEFSLLAGALIAPNHFQMALEHFDRFLLWLSSTEDIRWTRSLQWPEKFPKTWLTIYYYIDWFFIYFLYFLLVLLHFAPLQVVCCQRQRQRVSSCASRFGCDFCAYYPIVQMSARTRSEQRCIYLFFNANASKSWLTRRFFSSVRK